MLYKLSNAGGVEWRTPLAEQGAAHSGGITSDGYYWVGRSDLHSDFVEIVSHDGVLTEKHILTRINTERRLLICAAEHNRHYLQAGSGDTSERDRITAPSLSMTDSDGKRLWDDLRPFDQGHRIAVIGQEILSCAGIVITADGHVLAAQRIGVWPEGLSADEIFREWTHVGSHIRPATLVVALDLTGREITHLRDDGTKGGLLIAAPQGAVLVESEPHVHVRWLDSKLRDITPPLVLEDGRYDVVSAAYVTPQGGLLLAGCGGWTSRIYVQYISSRRTVSPQLTLPHLGNCGGAYWFSVGAHANEALLLSEAAPGLGSFVVTLGVPE